MKTSPIIAVTQKGRNNTENSSKIEAKIRSTILLYYMLVWKIQNPICGVILEESSPDSTNDEKDYYA